MTIYYLYLKTHNVTGLKYLGKTEKQDPFRYEGSGKYWRRHISKYGYDVTTVILLRTEDKAELRETGIFFSKLWNIVNSKEWANLTEETGDGRSSESMTGEKNPFFGKKHTLETRKKMGLKASRPGELNGFFGKEHSEETKKIISEKALERGPCWKGEFSPAQRMVNSGTHPWQGDHQKKLQTKRVSEGSHHLLGNVSVTDRDGVNRRIPREQYYSQEGESDQWEFVQMNTKEAKRRRAI